VLKKHNKIQKFTLNSTGQKISVAELPSRNEKLKIPQFVNEKEIQSELITIDLGSLVHSTQNLVGDGDKALLQPNEVIHFLMNS
jgi:hypothetical protein